MKKYLAYIALASGLAIGQMAAAETLRFATWNGEDNLKVLREISKRFEAKNPGVTVQIEPYADGYDKKLIVAFGAGSPPDVMYMWNYPKYYTSLLPLSDLIARDGEEMHIDDIPKGLLNASKIDGEIYALPVGFTTHVVFYNKDLFKQKGIAFPSENWTWSELREKAAKFRDKGTKTYGFAVEVKPDPYDFEQFLWSNGTKYISDDGKVLDGYMNSPESIEVLDMFADMVKKQQAIAVGVGDAKSGSAIFKAGKMAMYQSAMWSKGGLDESGINYGVAKLPSFNGKPLHSSIGASGMSIAKDSTKKDLAWKFLKFYASPEAVKLRVNDLPVRTSVANEMDMKNDPIYKPFFDILAVSNRETHAFLKNPKWGKIQSNLSRAIEATIMGKGTAEENLNDAVSRSKRYLK